MRYCFAVLIALTAGASSPFLAESQSPRQATQTGPTTCPAQTLPQSVQQAPAPPLAFRVIDQPGKIREEHGELFVGNYVHRVELETPNARGNYQPELSLVYRSSQPDEGWFGAGWDLSIGSIERNTRDGWQFSGREYVLNLQGRQLELVDCRQEGHFAAKYEDDFYLIRQIPSTGVPTEWEVKSPDGTTFIFGRTASARQVDPQNASYVFSWMLERVQDVSGNYLVAAYAQIGQRPYPKTISYNGHVNTSGVEDIQPTHKIYFHFESRPDVFESYLTRFRTRLDQRVKRLEITAGQQFFSTFEFTYRQSESTGGSLLTKVVQQGRDGTSATLLDMEYSQPAPLFRRDDHGRPRLQGLDGEKYWVQYPDLNGDGLADFCGRYASGMECEISGYSILDPYGHRLPFEASFETRRAFANADGWDSPSNFATVRFIDLDGDGNDDACGRHKTGLTCHITEPWGLEFRKGAVTSPIFRDADGFSERSRWETIVFGDINGDAKADVCGHLNDRFSCWLGNGDGAFTVRVDGPLVGVQSQYTLTARLVDIDGDHRADMCARTSAGLACWLWTGDHFESAARLTVILSGAPWDKEAHYRTVQFPDVNGDARADVCARGATNIECWLGDGNGLFVTQVVGPRLGSNTPFIYWDSVQYPDINADGRSDVCAHGERSFTCWVNRSDGYKGYLLSSYPYASPPLPHAGLFGIADANGDGSVELCSPEFSQFGAAGEFGCVRLFELKPNLLSSVHNALGGSVEVEYTSSAFFPNKALRFAFPVVRSLTESDGRGLLSRTSMRYEGGYYNYAAHRFYGFGEVTVSGPSGGGEVGGYSGQQLWFHQGLATEGLPASDVQAALIGRPYRIRLSDGFLGNLETITSLTYLRDDKPPYHHQVSRIDTQICRGSRFQQYPNFGRCRYPGGEKDASTIRTSQVFAYDSVGNVTAESHFGEQSVETDDILVRRQFTHNPSAWIVRTPIKAETYSVTGGQPVLVTSVQFLYDGAATCAPESPGTIAPTRGFVTQRSDWVSDNTWLPKRFGFDAFGNEVCRRDGNGNATVNVYDTRTQTLPIEETNALGQTTAREYWGLSNSTGGGIFGQVKQATDANQVVTAFTYDAFGRPHSEQRSDGRNTIRDFLNIGDPSTQRIRTRLLDGNQLLSDASSYIDGYGRVVIASQVGPGGAVVQTGYEYDSRGFLRSVTVPTFASRVRSSQQSKWEFVTDAQGFRLQSIDPTGSTRRMCQNQQAIIEVVENGNVRRVFYDSLGRMTRVDQFIAKASTRTEAYSCDVWGKAPYSTTQYEYDIRGLLTRTIDAKGNEWRFAYDGLGRRIEALDPDRGVRRFRYGGANDVREVTFSSGRRHFYSYDSLNRVIQLDVDRQKAHGRGDYVLDYDLPGISNSIGRLGRVRSLNGLTVSTTFDVGGHETERNIDWSGRQISIRKEYDALGRPQTVKYPSGRIVFYDYDGPVLAKIRSDSTVYAVYSDFTPSLEPTLIRYSNGTVTTRTYAAYMGTACDGLYGTRCSETVSSTAARIPFMDLKYVYDGGADVRQIHNGRKSISTSYDYDGVGRITAAYGAHGAKTYQYDSTHNRVGDSSLGSYQMSMSPNPPHGVLSVGQTTFRYDRDGSTSRDGALSFDYDGLGRVSRVARLGLDLHVVFDLHGNLVATRQGLDERLRLAPYLEQNRGGAAADEFLVHEGKPIARFRGNHVSYYHHDLFGSQRAVSSHDGSLSRTWDFDEFGNLSASSGVGPARDAPVFAGGMSSGVDDLIWFGERLYSPKRGAFEVPDRREADGREPRSLNPYTYAWHNPTRYIERDGEWPDWSNPGVRRGGIALVGLAGAIILFPPAAAAIATAEGAVALTAAQVAFTQLAIAGGASTMQLIGAMFQLTSDPAVAESSDEAWSWAASMMDPSSAMAGSISLMALGNPNAGFFTASLLSVNSGVRSLFQSASRTEAIGNGLLLVPSLDVAPPQRGKFWEPPDPLGIGPAIGRGGFDPEAEGRDRYKYIG